MILGFGCMCGDLYYGMRCCCCCGCCCCCCCCCCRRVGNYKRYLPVVFVQAYAVRNSPASLWPDAAVLDRAVRATFAGQRALDGCMPDRVQADGTAVYSPGGNTPAAAFSDHAWDNMPFAALLLTAATEKIQSMGGGNDADPAAAAAELFCDLEPAVRE